MLCEPGEVSLHSLQCCQLGPVHPLPPFIFPCFHLSPPSKADPMLVLGAGTSWELAYSLGLWLAEIPPHPLLWARTQSAVLQYSLKGGKSFKTNFPWFASPMFPTVKSSRGYGLPSQCSIPQIISNPRIAANVNSGPLEGNCNNCKLPCTILVELVFSSTIGYGEAPTSQKKFTPPWLSLLQFSQLGKLSKNCYRVLKQYCFL